MSEMDKRAPLKPLHYISLLSPDNSQICSSLNSLLLIILYLYSAKGKIMAAAVYLQNTRQLTIFSGSCLGKRGVYRGHALSSSFTEG